MQRVGIPTSRNIGGDVFESFSALNDLIKKNDGVRSFSIKTNSCYDADAPFSEDQQTHIRITNSYHDVNQICNSYLRFKFEVKFKMGKDITITKTTGKHCTPYRIFLGWKNANEIIKQLEVENNNADCDYLQTEGSKEGFCYSVYKPKEEKKNTRYAHTTYDAANRGLPGVCGGYIDLIKSSNVANTSLTFDHTNTEFTGTLNCILPIQDLLAFQAFEEFPGCLGDIVLKIFINSKSMVWTYVDPIEIENNELFMKSGIEKIRGNATGCIKLPYDHRFEQVNQPLIIPVSYTSEDEARISLMECGETTLTITSLTCTDLKCDVAGYNVTQECKRNLAVMFTPEKPYIIPSQHLDVKSMPKALNHGANYNADFTYALHNVTDFVLAWPRRSSDQTVFWNPQLTNLQLHVDGKLFPQLHYLTTWDDRFYTSMMEASDLDNYYEADEEYANSLTTNFPNDMKKMPFDTTSFIATIQAERGGAGYFFDGLETGNVNVNIQLDFNADTASKYCTDYSTVAPQIWFTRDTFWTVDNVNGLKYHKTQTPPIYASSEDL